MKRIGIDSFTVWVNLDIFTYFNPHLTAKVIEVYEGTGEIKDEYDRKPIFKTVEGVKYKAHILLPFGKRPILQLTMNSRMLKKRYYVNKHIQTINADNFRYIFTDVCDTIGLECNYYDFIDNSTIYDVDICSDSNINSLDFERICSSVNCNPYGTQFYITLDGTYLERSKKVTGCQYSERKKSSISHPFVKWYTKYWEFIHKSHEFYAIFCPDFINENYRRCEGQIKNARHFKWLEKRGCLPQGFCDNGVSLGNMLSLSEVHLNECLDELIFQYGTKLKVERKKGGVNATDFILMECMAFLMDEGFTFEDQLRFLDDYTDNPETVTTAKSRLRKRGIKAFLSSYGSENLVLVDDDIIKVKGKKVSQLGVQ